MINHSLNKWRNGEKSLGAWINLPEVHVAESLARTGLDWLCFDLQHGLMDYRDLTVLLPAVAGLPVTPLVRVAANAGDQIGKALDAGAEGVIVPMVNSGAEARAAAEACRYPPQGNRSCGPMRPAMLEGLPYLMTANDAVACLAMVETEQGLANVDEIAATEGIDGIFVGPMDLCYGLGLKPGEFADPRFSEALGAILASCKKHGKVAGMFGYTPELAATALEQGFVFASVGTDISFLREGTTGALKRAGFDPEQKESAGY